MNISLPSFPSFDCESNPNTLNQRWKKWSEKLENLFTAIAITETEQKRALLRHYMGEEMDDVFNSLPTTGTSFESAISAISSHFSSQQNVEYEAYVFRQIKQRPDETLDQFISKLRKSAKSCAFSSEEREIKSQLILGCYSSRLRRFALQNPNKDLDEVIQFGRIGEITDQQATVIEASLHPNNVNVIRSKTPTVAAANEPSQTLKKTYRHDTERNKKYSDKQRNTKCSYCGEGWHPNGLSECRARGKTCNYCLKLNHFSKVCLAKGNKLVNKKNDTFKSKTKQGTFQLGASEVESHETVEYVLTNFSIKHINQQGAGHETVTLQIQNMNVDFIIDTGSTKNMLNYNDFQKLNINSSVNKDMTKTFVYGSEVPMETHGIVSIPVVYNAKTYKLDFTVPKHGGPSLLGKTTLLQLGIIRFLHRLETNLSGEKHDNEPIQDILEPFDSLFHGIGKCNTTQIKLHIDNVAPVIQKHRRVPYHIRDKVEEEQHTLLANDIIERIPEQQPTTWISLIVVVPKRDDSSGIRICVDMTLANQVIARERHPSPTIDDVIDDLKGATIFSRLDLLKGYHQFELEQESRHITTFSTHMGCFRYKRLSFGITSASEIFQHELSKIISGISGAMNISDDILIYGKNTNEHDKSLKEVLKKLQSSGLTLNRSKCSFRQSELKFMGLVFTSHGVKTDEAKVKAILEITNPANVKDLRSLLGMVNFSSRFLPDLATVTKPLRELTKKGAKWLWTNIHQNSLDNIKQLMSRAKSLAYFDKNKSSVIWTDAGPRGLGAILTQTDDKGQQYIIAYASHSLNQTEMRYSQIEKEALAIVWSIKYFHMYLFGHAFKVVTDHSPLLSIFNKPNMVLSPRIER